MPRKFTAEARREAAAQAYKLMLARATFTEIGEKLGTTRQTASKLVKEEQVRMRDERGDTETEKLVFERDRAIGTLDETIRYAWQRLRDPNLNVNSLNQSGYLNSVISAQMGICKILGLAEFKDDEVDDGVLMLAKIIERMPEKKKAKG